jgi:two-component system sensor histidine kinase MtrB
MGAWPLDGGGGDLRAAEIAHDLRMPLALILAHCERLSATLTRGDQLSEIEQIRSTADRMGRQVDCLVRADASAVQLDVAGLVTEVVERLRPLAHARGREIVLQELPPAVALADPAGLELALQNVIDNALRHAREEPVRVSVSAGLRNVRIKVADDGPGIPMSQRARVLEPRAQLAVGEHRPGSGGLGLSIASDTLRAHGGAIRIAESEQGGALVTLQLPSLSRRARSASRPFSRRA